MIGLDYFTCYEFLFAISLQNRHFSSYLIFCVFRANEEQSGRGARDTCLPPLRVSRAPRSHRACLRFPVKREKNNAYSAGYFASFSNVHTTLAHIQSSYFNKIENHCMD